MAAVSEPAKRAPARKRAPAKKQQPAKGSSGVAGPASATPPGPPAEDSRSVNQWLNDLKAVPLRIEVFDQWWEFKQPTGGRALAWDVLLPSQGIRAALASMMLDETAAPDRTFTGADGVEHVLKGTPGTAAADRFLAAATDWVIPEAAQEFWQRMERAIFGPGEASAS